MKFKNINRILIASSIIIMSLTAYTEKAFAGLNHDEIVEQVYNDFIAEGKNSTTFICDDPSAISRELIDEIHAIDKEDTLFDGIMLDIRGSELITLEGNKCTIEIKNAYDINEADELTDKMVEEIKADIPENASEKEIFYKIAKYIKKNFSYDTEEYYGDKNYKNFVDAYYGDRKINCEGFAALTYLITNKMGLDSKLFLGKKHVYNGIRFADDDRYTVVDFSGNSPSGLIPAVAVFYPQYAGNNDTKKFASAIDLIKAFGYNITH